MRVGLDISQAVKWKGRGIARYISEILPFLLTHSGDGPDDFSPVLYVAGDRIFRRGPLANLVGGATTRWLPTRFYLPRRGLDLFHSFGNYLPSHSRVPLTFTVHDFRVLDLGESGEGTRLRRNVARSAGILCLTEHGRSRLLHHFPDYSPERIAVVPHGVDHSQFKPIRAQEAQAIATRHGLRVPYVLQLGSWFPHKNLELAIKAFAQSQARKEGFRMAFVGGGATEDYRNRLETLVAQHGVQDFVDWVENVPSKDIPHVVAAASCLLQPSHYEGFALPLLEAMAVGTPGVVSDSSCLPEVSGGVWPIVKQDDVDAFAAGLDSVIIDRDRRDQIISAGLARAAQYTWPATAQKTVEFLKRIAAM